MRLPDATTLALIVELDQRATSIAQAARAVGVAQPNASRMLRNFEKENGIPLLVRGAQGTRLTPQGQAVATWAAEVMVGYQHLCAGLDALTNDVKGRLRIAASMTIAEYLLPQWLERFRAQRPGGVQNAGFDDSGFDIAMSVANSESVADQVRTGACDLGLIESVNVPADLSSARIGSDELVIVATPDVARGLTGRARSRGMVAALDAHALAGLALIVREQGSGTRTVIERALAVAGGVLIAAEFPSNAAVKTAALASMAPAALSRRAVAAELRTGQLVELEVAESVDLSRPLHALWPRGTRLRGVAADFLALVQNTRILKDGETFTLG